MSYAQDVLLKYVTRIEKSNQYHIKEENDTFYYSHKEKDLKFHHRILNVPFPEPFRNEGVEATLIHLHTSAGDEEYWLHVYEKGHEIRLDVSFTENSFNAWTTVEKGEFEGISRYQEIKEWFHTYVQTLPNWRLYFVTGMNIYDEGVKRKGVSG